MSIKGHCRSEKGCQVDFPLFFLCLVLFHSAVSEGEEELQEMFIKIRNTQAHKSGGNASISEDKII